MDNFIKKYRDYLGIPAEGLEYNGSFDLDSYGVAIDFFAGDKLSVQLWEDYDDLPDRADGVWKKGLLTATFEHL